MDLIDRLQAISQRIPKLVDHVKTEEATKNALIMPFIQALGYDVFNPLEVVPELDADVGVKKGEKVDYALMKDGKPVILIECKKYGQTLSLKNASQLYRYFSVLEARFAILTDGNRYEFYSDLDSPNKMDSKPYMVIEMLTISEDDARKLKQLTNMHFDAEKALESASTLKYSREIKRLLDAQRDSPDEEFLKFFISRIYSGRMTQRVLTDFEPIVKKAFETYLSDEVDQVLLDAKQRNAQHQAEARESEHEDQADDEQDGVITTEEEIEAYHVVKAIMRQYLDVERITIKDRKTYCNILLDGNNRQPICRLHFNTSQKYLGVFDKEKNEERIPIDVVDDIYNFASQIRAGANHYESPQT